MTERRNAVTKIVIGAVAVPVVLLSLFIGYMLLPERHPPMTGECYKSVTGTRWCAEE